MDVEELCGAPVEADTLALVDLALAVVGGDALLLACLCETICARVLAVRSHVAREIPSYAACACVRACICV